MKQLELRIDWARTDDHIIVESLNGKIIRFHEDKLKQFLRVVKIFNPYVYYSADFFEKQQHIKGCIK